MAIKKNSKIEQMARLAVNEISDWYSRSFLGRMFGGERSIDRECGYPQADPTTDDYYRMFKRGDIAKRIVTIYPEKCWEKNPEIYETEDEDKTEFENVWDEMDKNLKVMSYLKRIDTISGIGRFGVLFLGTDDIKNRNELQKPLKKKSQLLYLKALGEDKVTVKNWESDTSNPRYGQPKTYQLILGETEGLDVDSTEVLVDWTRIIHIADERTDSDIFGEPRLKAVYNRMLDLLKIVGGSGEMFWRGAYNGMIFETDGESTLSQTSSEMDEEVANFYNGLQRYMILQGINAKQIAPNISDPASHFNTQMTCIASTVGVPLRILLGSEQAQLASGQDKSNFQERITARQESYVVPFIIEPFIDRLIEYGILPEPKEYFVDFPDATAPSGKDKADITKIRTSALGEYVSKNIETIYPPKQFLMNEMGVDADSIDAIDEELQELIKQEEEIAKLDQQKMEEQMMLEKTMNGDVVPNPQIPANQNTTPNPGVPNE